MDAEDTKKTWTDWALRAVALVGLVAILVLGAWGIIQLAFDMPDFLGSIGNSATSLFEQSPATSTNPIPSTEQPAIQKTVEVSAPSLAISGQPFTLSWSHVDGGNQYAYQISYSCENAVTLEAPLPTGALEDVPCNTPFNYTNATQSLTLTPKLTGRTQIAVQLTVTAQELSNNAVAAVGSATTTVLPATSTPAASNKTTTPGAKYTPATKTATVLYGLPNLTTTIVSATPTATGYSIEFLIRNTGSNVASAGWTFAASIPTYALTTSAVGYNYTSQPQQSLLPGDSILYTMSFPVSAVQNYYPYNNSYSPTCGYVQDYTYNGYSNYPDGSSYSCTNYTQPPYAYSTSNYVFSVTADPSGYLIESSKTDNTASVSF